MTDTAAAAVSSDAAAQEAKMPAREVKLRRIQYGGDEAAEGRMVTLAAIGPPAVGKTTMLARIQTPEIFRSERNSTTGVDLFSIYATIKHRGKDTAVKLLLRDIAGQDKFTHMLPAFARDVDGCFVMFDSTNADTLVLALRWLTELRKSNSYAVCMLVATKIDVFESGPGKPFYTLADMQEVAAKNLCMAGFAEISSKTTKNLELAVERLAEMAYAERAASDAALVDDNRASTIRIGAAKVHEKKRCDC